MNPLALKIIPMAEKQADSIYIVYGISLTYPIHLTHVQICDVK